MKLRTYFLSCEFIYTYNIQDFGFGTYGSFRNFLKISVHVSATTFILRVSMNFASSPDIHPSNKVSDNLVNEYIFLYHLSFISSASFGRSHNKIISEIVGERNGLSYSRKILLTVPKFNRFIASILYFGKMGSNNCGFSFKNPKGTVHITWSV